MSLAHKMVADGIVSEIIDEAPTEKITVIYPNGIEVETGKELTPFQVKDEPKVTWNADPEKYYLLTMIDPDAPSRQDPKYGPANHWLIGNIKGNDLSTGHLMNSYRGSLPGKGSALHRYIFLVYEQKDKVTFNEPGPDVESRAHRRNFSVRKFLTKYDIGRIVAGNYYVAKWDSYAQEVRDNRDNIK